MDDRLRSNTRRARQGDELSAARVIQDRLRLGTLTQEAAHLAALCGDEGAALALDVEPAKTLGKLMAEIPDSPMGTEALTRGALAAWESWLTKRPGTHQSIRDQLAAGLEWDRTGDRTAWLVRIRRVGRVNVPLPRPEWAAAYFARSRMTKSISSCVDGQYDEASRLFRHDEARRMPSFEPQSHPRIRAKFAEAVRLVVARRIIRWTLEGT